MSAEAHIKIVQHLYEAFGRGDIADILDHVTDDVDWAAEAAGHGAPWYGVRHGREEVAAFFEEFGSTIEVQDFTPVVYAGTDGEVLTMVRFAGRSRSTGRSVAMQLHHCFHFRDGKVTYFRGSEDTAQTEAALTG